MVLLGVENGGVQWRFSYCSLLCLALCHGVVMVMAVGVQGLGLFVARDLEKHTMVIEYIGDLIRNEVANNREKEYDNQVSTPVQPEPLGSPWTWRDGRLFDCLHAEHDFPKS